MPLTSVERDICKFVVWRLLNENDVTPRHLLLKEFRGALADPLRKLVDRGVLRTVDYTYGSENYLPRALAFHACGDSEALSFAQKSTEIVLQALLTLFDGEVGKAPTDQKHFSPSDVEAAARRLEFDVDEKLVRTGLYFAEEISVFDSLQRDAKQIYPTVFRVGERIYQITKVSNPWDLHIIQNSASLDRSAWDIAQNIVAEQSSGGDIETLENNILEARFSTVVRTSRKIFLVHGHADDIKQAVAKFLRSLGLNVVILHEQPNQGRTIVEKFEQHSDVGFAVVLLTPDDVGAPISKPEKSNKRARQNVILELGYFIGKLGRERVCPIHVEDIELPSDLHGVLWVPYDKSGEWRSQLAKEIQAAGIKVNFNHSKEA